MISKVAHIGLFVKDMDKMVNFYTNVLEFPIRTKMDMDDGCKVVVLEKNGSMLELVKLPGFSAAGDSTINHISFEVDDIEEEIKKLEAKGVVFEQTAPLSRTYTECSGFSVKFIMFRGPENEYLELDQYCE